MSVIALLAALWQFEASYDARSYSGEIRIPLMAAAVGVQVLGNASDTDPSRQEDFLAPEFVWFISPGCSLRAQLARALRPDSDDSVSLSVSWQF
jgi:hypothetical protein